MIWRRSSVFRYIIVFGIGMLTYGEIFVYYVQAAFWPEIDCPPNNPACTKILFIADPQIQGEYALPSPLKQIFIWDSDRYLKKTFYQAVNHFKPHMLVFLGDLMDEGSISTNEQYKNYVERLLDIFKETYSTLQIWLPGDNDIGGEHEPIREDKIKAFQKFFTYPNTVVETRNVALYPVSGITHTMPKVTPLQQEDKVEIVISHYPLGRTAFGAKVHKEIQPHVYFCAHDHTSKFRLYNKKNGFGMTIVKNKNLMNFSIEIQVDFKDDYFIEIFVPTCSYRMGVPDMGYGVAVIDNEKKKMKYTVLWSPSRFPYLLAYLGFFITISFYTLLYTSYRFLLIQQKIQIRRLMRMRGDKDTQPLL